MRIGSKIFAPSRWAIVLFLVVGLIMLLLGNWQLSRADEKITLMERAESASLAQAVPLASLDLVKTESVSAVLSPAEAA